MLRDYLTGVGRFSPAAKLFLFGQFLGGISSATLWVLRNLYLKEAGMSETVIGHALTMSSLGILVVGVPLSFLMDRGGLKWYLIGGVLSQGVALLITAMWPTTGPVYAASFIAGAGNTLLGVGASPFYMRHSTAFERPYLFGVGNALGPAAGLFGASLVGVHALVFGEELHHQRDMLLISAASTVAAALVFVLIRDEAAEIKETRQEIDLPLATKLCLPEFLVGLGAGLTIPFINLYFANRFHKGPAEISSYFSYAQVVTFIAFLAAPVFARRYGGVRTVVACQMLSIPFFAVMAFTLSPWIAVFGFLGRHALMNMAGPVASNFAMEVVPAKQRALTSGLKTVAWNGSWAVSTSVAGWLISHPTYAVDGRGRFVVDGFTVTMLSTIGLYVIASTIYYWFWHRVPVMQPLGQPVAKMTS